jgi:transcription antitermination protein NusB
MRVRTRARELALQFLFEHDFHGAGHEVEAEAFLRRALEGRSGAREAEAYALALIRGVLAHKEHIDELLQAAARNWDLERMAAVDRNALRIGCYELLYAPEIPMKVAINEAIELGKRFSTEASGAFINGLLDRIRKDHDIS